MKMNEMLIFKWSLRIALLSLIFGYLCFFKFHWNLIGVLCAAVFSGSYVAGWFFRGRLLDGDN